MCSAKACSGWPWGIFQENVPFQSTTQSRNVDPVLMCVLLDTKGYKHTVKTEFLWLSKSLCVSAATGTAFAFVFSEAGLLKVLSSFQLGFCLSLIRNELIFTDSRHLHTCAPNLSVPGTPELEFSTPKVCWGSLSVFLINLSQASQTFFTSLWQRWLW